MVNWLIERAKRTPYYDLPGYMNRYWLVPYRAVIKRTIDEIGYEDVKGIRRTFCNPYTVTDGTGPVSPWRRPIAWLLQRFDIAVRVHEILRSDKERHPHSHPWSYLTVILRNGYTEERYDDKGDVIAIKHHAAGSVLFRRAGSLHRLTLFGEKPATTLFITFKKRGSWGFQVDGKVIPHYEYLKGRQ